MLIFHSQCWLLSCSRISLSQTLPLNFPSRSLLIRSIFKLITQSARPITHKNTASSGVKNNAAHFYFAFYPHIKSRPLCRTEKHNTKLTHLVADDAFCFLSKQTRGKFGENSKTRREKQNWFYFFLFSSTHCTVKQPTPVFLDWFPFIFFLSLAKKEDFSSPVWIFLLTQSASAQEKRATVENLNRTEQRCVRD